MASRRELQALITLAGKVDPSMQAAMQKAAGLTDKATNAMKRGEKQAMSMGKAIKASFAGNLLANGVSRMASAVGSQLKQGVQLASDLAEVQNVVDVTFGKSSSQIDKWAKSTLNAYGVTELQAKKYSGTMGAMLQSSGVANDKALMMSQNLSQLSGDMSSFYNITADEAWEKIRSGISGETEPLKQLGINMSVANMESFALSKGIKTSWNQMDQATQTQLRYMYLMQATSKAQGDFVRTSEGAANQQRLLKANIDQLSASLMVKLLPAITKGLKFANEFISSGGFERMAKTGEKLIPIVVGLGAGFATFKALSFVATAMQTAGMAASVATFPMWAMTTATTAFGAAVAFVTSPIFLTAAAITAVITASVLLYKNWDVVSVKLTAGWDGIKLAFTSGVDWLIAKIDWLIQKINAIPGIEIPIGTAPTTKDIKVKKDYSTNPKMQEFAIGGIATRASIFGEAGPEMAIPLSRSKRSYELLNQTAQILGIDQSKSNGGNVYHFHFPGVNPMDKTSIMDAVLKAMRELGHDEGRVVYG